MNVKRERPGRQRMLTAFGETKSLKRWAEDSRCSVAQSVLMARLKSGYSPEDAVSAPYRPGNVRYEAFGETKSLADWKRDPRCVVSFQALVKRVRAGMPVEQAISKPMVRELVDFEAFGEVRRLKDWVTDPRCTVSPAAIGLRLRSGMSLEEAMTRPKTPPPKTIPPPHWTLIEAFGEAKTCNLWAQDSRCKVSGITLKKRLSAGIPPERAMTMSSGEFLDIRGRKPRFSPLGRIDTFGESKTMNEWSRDARSLVSAPTIKKRLAAGMSAERAITTPPELVPRHLTAFGETKSVRAWARDPRAAVCEETIRQRVTRGYQPESAITDPPGHPGTRLFWDLAKRGLADPDGKSLKTFELGSS